MNRRIKLFENFDEPVFESTVKQLWSKIKAMDGDAEKDPTEQWSDEEALDWAVGFAREYGLYHPEDSADQVVWSGKTPKDFKKVDKQMENFCNVDWSKSDFTANFDEREEFTMVAFVNDTVNGMEPGNADKYMLSGLFGYKKDMNERNKTLRSKLKINEEKSISIKNSKEGAKLAPAIPIKKGMKFKVYSPELQNLFTVTAIEDEWKQDDFRTVNFMFDPSDWEDGKKDVKGYAEAYMGDGPSDPASDYWELGLEN